MSFDREGFRHRLGAIEHERWGHWQSYLHSLCTRHEDGSLTIPAHLVTRWDRQIATPYEELSSEERGADLDQVDRYWPLIELLIDAVEKGRA